MGENGRKIPLSRFSVPPRYFPLLSVIQNTKKRSRPFDLLRFCYPFG